MMFSSSVANYLTATNFRGAAPTRIVATDPPQPQPDQLSEKQKDSRKSAILLRSSPSLYVN